MKKILTTDAAPKAIGPYSQAVSAGGFLFCSGQIPLDPETGELVGATIAEQAERVLANIEGVLQGAGLTFDHIVKTTIFLIDLADFATVNEIYGRRFTAAPPARSTVEVKALPRGARLEIEVIAVQG
jgi:2-iminobutanoate/2-iminopropanoate deaminase